MQLCQDHLAPCVCLWQRDGQLSHVFWEASDAQSEVYRDHWLSMSGRFPPFPRHLHFTPACFPSRVVCSFPCQWEVWPGMSDARVIFLTSSGSSLCWRRHPRRKGSLVGRQSCAWQRGRSSFAPIVSLWCDLVGIWERMANWWSTNACRCARSRPLCS